MSATTLQKTKHRTETPSTASNGKIRVVVIDDHPLCRKGLQHTILEDDRFEFVGEAETTETGYELVRKQKPDVAILDITPSGINALELAGVIKARKLKTRLVVLTVLNDERLFNKALNLGIKGYVLKKSGAAEVLSCVAAVAAGEAYISPFLTDFLLRRRSQIEFLELGRPGLQQLTPAERRILKQIALGKTSQAIATDFSISRRTVESHRTSISSKLQLKGPYSLLQFAVEHRDALSHLT